MPSSPESLFHAAGLEASGVVRWGTPIPAQRPGVYAVSWAMESDTSLVDAPVLPASRVAFNSLLSAHPELSVDGSQANFDSFTERLSKFWVPDEPILYIGKAGTSLGNRVRQYYTTRLGARSPHSGGWWLKIVDGFEQLFVHYATADDPDAAEQIMLNAYRAAADPASTALLHDPERIAPFANVDTATRQFKRHGLSNYKDTRTMRSGRAVQTKPQRPSTASRGPSAPPTGGATTVYSQKVTDKDRSSSYLRIPALSKHVFPDHSSTIRIEIHGAILDVPWRPNGGRSGTVGLGIGIMRNLHEHDERIPIDVLPDRYRIRAQY